MAQQAVETKRTTIAHACTTFAISETCYRYQAKRTGGDDVIADCLLQLSTAYRTWGFRLFYLHLRNVKHFVLNHKRVYNAAFCCKGSHKLAVNGAARSAAQLHSAPHCL